MKTYEAYNRILMVVDGDVHGILFINVLLGGLNRLLNEMPRLLAIILKRI